MTAIDLDGTTEVKRSVLHLNSITPVVASRIRISCSAYLLEEAQCSSHRMTYEFAMAKFDYLQRCCLAITCKTLQST